MISVLICFQKPNLQKKSTWKHVLIKGGNILGNLLKVVSKHNYVTNNGKDWNSKFSLNWRYFQTTFFTCKQKTDQLIVEDHLDHNTWEKPKIGRSIKDLKNSLKIETKYKLLHSKLLLTLKQLALYRSCTTWPMLVLEAWGKWGSSRWTTNITSTFLDKADPSSRANKTSFRTSSCIPGPKNWHPLALTAAQRFALSCCGFWCCSINSVTDLSPKLRAARIALALPSGSINWHPTKVTSFRCMGRETTPMPIELFGTVWNGFK